MNHLHRDRRGYTMTFWAVFIGFVLVPAFALAIELGRYFYAISEVAKAADAAAVAASADSQLFSAEVGPKSQHPY